MTTLQIFRILWARRRLVMLCVTTLVVLTFVSSALLPKTYKASADVIIDMRQSDPLLGTQPNHPLDLSYIATQVDIIESERVARRVVETMKLAQLPEYETAWREKTGGRGDIRNWVAEQLLKKLEVRPSKESNVVRISFKDRAPEKASMIANGFANTYLTTVADLKLDPARQNATFFEAQARASRAELEAAQTKLSAFQRSKNIVAVDEKLDVENARLAELSTQLVAIQAVVTESRSRAASINSRNNEDMAEVLESRLIQQLKADIAKSQGKLQEVSTRLGPAHPEYQSVQAELTSLKGQLQAETRKYAGSVNLTGSVNAQREAQIRASLDAQRSKVLKLKSQRDELAVIQREVEAAQKGYEQIVQRQRMTSMESQNRLTNVALLTPAVDPIEPASPKVLLNTAIAALFGLLIGMALALLQEMRDRRARDVSDLVENFNLPVLVSVPAAGSRRTGELLPRATHLLPRP